MEQKKLYKTEDNKMICGVCNGVAEYFNADPSIIRLLWALFALCAGSGLVLYIIAAVILPDKKMVV